MDRDLLRALKDTNVRLLNKPQIRLLDDVFSAIESQVDVYASDKLNDVTNYNVAINISEIQEKFRSIIKHLKEGKSSREKFLITYPRWKKKREDGIVKLKQIAEDINSTRYGSNVTKVVGYSTSLVGGALTFMSAITLPFSLGLTTPLVVAGGSAIFLGSATAIGTSVREFVLLKNSVNEAQEIIKEDKAYFAELSDWMTRAEELERALAAVLNIDIFQGLKESVKNLTEKVSTSNGGKVYQSRFQIRKMITTIFDQLLPSMKGTAHLPSVGLYMLILTAIYLLYQNSENYITVHFATATMKVMMGVASVIDNTGDIVRFASLFTSNALLAKNIGKAVGRGIISVAGVALDAISLAITSNDLCNGSLAPEADAIQKASVELEKETKLLQKVYEELCDHHANSLNCLHP